MAGTDPGADSAQGKSIRKGGLFVGEADSRSALRAGERCFSGGGGSVAQRRFECHALCPASRSTDDPVFARREARLDRRFLTKFFLGERRSSGEGAPLLEQEGGTRQPDSAPRPPLKGRTRGAGRRA